MKYTVNVGNIGNIEFTNKKEATAAFNEYVSQSKQNYGRAAGEPVILLKGDEILQEHTPQREPEIIILDAHGIYIPQLFCQNFAQQITNKEEIQDDIDICLQGPDHPEYNEAWTEILENAELTNDEGENYTIGYLPDSTDLWGIPENYEFPED